MSEIFVKFTLGQYLKPNSHKIALSLPELVSQTNSFSIKNRPGCTPTLIGSKPKELYLKYNVKCNLKTSNPAGHTVQVRFDLSKVNQSLKATDLDIKVSCSCEAFLYWGGQWNLNQRDALEGQPRPELVAPTERLDLRQNFVICKHCKAVFERILPSVQHNINNIIREKTVEEKKKTLPDTTKERTRIRQEQMKKRQEIQKQRKRKNKDVQKDLLESLKRREEERIRKELGEDTHPEAVVRNQPVTPEVKEEHHMLNTVPDATGYSEVEPEKKAPTTVPDATGYSEETETETEATDSLEKEEVERLEKEEIDKKFMEDLDQRKEERKQKDNL
jgi:hypothetical protein